MRRRDFLKAGASGAVFSVAAASGGAGHVSAEPLVPVRGADVMRSYSAKEHRRRLENIQFCEGAIRGCMKKHLITNYLPAHACYNLCEYPCLTMWEPNEYDEQELDRLRDLGVDIVHVFDDWNDSLRLFGGHKLTALNPDGFRKFVGMVHARGMKILTYVSTGFIQKTDPDFRQEWSREGDVLVLGYWNMARCSPASSGWRAYVLPRIVQVMEDFGVDGLYDDGGYVANSYGRIPKPTSDEVAAFEESPDFDGAFTDLLALLYGEVKRRGGILKLHVNAADQPMTRGLRVYDYLWVGEGVGNAAQLRERVKDFPPYVVPCIDMNFTTVEDKDEPYLHAIPYMQFPILAGGRPMTGERGMIPGVSYPNPNDFWMERCREAWKQYQANPNGPYTYSMWDPLPARTEMRPTHAHWLKQYLPMTEEGTWAWLEVRDSNLFANPLPKDVVASAFANRDLYVTLANYGGEPVEVATNGVYVPMDDPAVPPQTQWKLAGGTLRILRRQA